MKPIALLLASAFSVFSFAYMSAKDTTAYHNHVQKILSKSIFNQELGPWSQYDRVFHYDSDMAMFYQTKISKEGITFEYNPALIYAIASQYSLLPEKSQLKGKTGWQTKNLPPLAEGYPNSPCPNSIRYFFRPSSQSNNYTFVILPPAFAKWEDGLFYNQTISVLDKQFNKPNIIALDGYLSPAFLKSCTHIPWNTKALAEDLHARLRYTIRSVSFYGDMDKIGVIGYGEGATLVGPMLAKDAKWAKEFGSDKLRLFNLGGMAFSPILNALSAYNNMSAGMIKDYPHLNTSFTHMLKNYLFHGLDLTAKYHSLSLPTTTDLSWQEVIKLYDHNAGQFTTMVLRERRMRELQMVLKAFSLNTDRYFGDIADSERRFTRYGVDLDKVQKGEHNYYHIFINMGFRDSYPGIAGNLDTQNLKDLYEHITDPRPMLASIDRPLLIYYSKDNPLINSTKKTLTQHYYLSQPAEINYVLNHAKKNPNIIVFNPRYGSHNGHFLDPIFEDLVSGFFKYPLTQKAL